jgi:hypothetical protein
LLIVALVICASFLAFRRSVGQPTYEGKTVEEWLRSPDWAKRKRHVELVILTGFGDKSVPVLREILLRKRTRQELAIWENVPIVRQIYGSRITRAELKERIISILEPLELIGGKCLPTLEELAQNESEPPRVRQLAIRALTRFRVSNAPFKAALARLQNDPAVAPDATRAFFALQAQEDEQKERAGNMEINRLRNQMDESAKKSTLDLLTRTSLWDKGQPGFGFPSQ